MVAATYSVPKYTIKKQGIKDIKNNNSCGKATFGIQKCLVSPLLAIFSQIRTQKVFSDSLTTQMIVPSSPTGTASAMAVFTGRFPVMAMAVPTTPARQMSPGSAPPAPMNPRYKMLICAPTIAPVIGSPRITPAKKPETSGRINVHQFTPRIKLLFPR